jgi:DNA polymerase-3 subunit alpha
LAGFTLSEADSLRKARGKKKKDLMVKYGAQFVAGCAKSGIPNAKAVALYDAMAKFAEYGFNKSHSAAYAVVAYQTAYLKANYPAEYMAALLSLKQGKTEDVVAYIEESRRIGLEIAGPDVNASEVHFAIEGGPNGHTLRFSLTAIKGVGEKAVETIVAARAAGGPFRDLYDFCERVDLRLVNKGALEGLIRAGALDALAGTGGRGCLSAMLEEAMAHGAAVRRDRDSGQGSLFGEEAQTPARPRNADAPDWPQAQRLEEEKKVLGFYFSGHPLADYRELIEGLSSSPCRALRDIPDGYEVLLGAFVNAVQPKVTRDGKRMAVLMVEDFTGSIQVVVFPRTFEQYRELIRADRVLVFRGRVRHGEAAGPSVSLMAEELLTLEQAVLRHIHGVLLVLRQEDLAAPVAFRPQAPTVPGHQGTAEAWGQGATAPSGNGATLDAWRERLESLVELLKAFPGQTPLWFQVELAGPTGAPARVWVRAGPSLRVRPDVELFKGLRQLLPRGAVHLQAEANQARRAPEPRWKAQAALKG